MNTVKYIDGSTLRIFEDAGNGLYRTSRKGVYVAKSDGDEKWVCITLKENKSPIESTEEDNSFDEITEGITKMVIEEPPKPKKIVKIKRVTK